MTQVETTPQAEPQTNTNPLVREQLTLLIERETRYQLDGILKQMQGMAKDFNIGVKGDKRSPLRNLLTTAMDRTASLEVIKNYISYQTARSEDIGKVLKLPSQNNRDKYASNFGTELIKALDALETDANAILDAIASTLSNDHAVREIIAPETPSREIEVIDLHLKLVQLYLGYLVREHTALKGTQTYRN